MSTGGVDGGSVRHHLADIHGMERTILPCRNVPAGNQRVRTNSVSAVWERSRPLIRPRPLTAGMSEVRFDSVMLFRQRESLPLVMVVVVTKDVEKDVEHQHQDQPYQCDHQPPGKDPLCHSCISLHR